MSKRLIDANELISAMYYYEHNEGGLTAYDAQDIINKAPSIDIVRCRDCKYYEAKEDWCYWRDEYTEPEYFCSYGEVRDE